MQLCPLLRCIGQLFSLGKTWGGLCPKCLSHTNVSAMSDSRRALALSCRSIQSMSVRRSRQGSLMPTSLDTIIPKGRVQRICARIFIDSTFWYDYWHCHRLPSRSFSLGGRQFHICCRCTGIALGTLLLPLVVVLPRSIPSAYAVVPTLFFVDGVTQAMCLRVSTNALRFWTGLLMPVSLLGLIVVAMQ